MSFVDAIVACLFRRYGTFQGRASRSEFWYFTLFCFILYVPVELTVEVGWYLGLSLGVLSEGESPALWGLQLPYLSLILLGLLVLVPECAVAVRRMHDVNRSGALVLLPTLVMCLSLASALTAQLTEVRSLIMLGAGLSGCAGILAIACFIMTLQKGTPGPNRYGNEPLA